MQSKRQRKERLLKHPSRDNAMTIEANQHRSLQQVGEMKRFTFVTIIVLSMIGFTGITGTPTIAASDNTEKKPRSEKETQQMLDQVEGVALSIAVQRLPTLAILRLAVAGAMV